MSFDRDVMNPNAQTHVPVTVDVPAESAWTGEGRQYMEPPTLWKAGVKVVHKLTGREAVIYRMDLGTMQFRPFYLDTQSHAGRTEWESSRDWNVSVTLHPDEMAKRDVRKKLDAEISALDPDELEAMHALVDGDDPAKGLAKLNALRKLGVIKSKPAVAAVAIEEAGAKKKSAKKDDGAA